jgi:hypothetical protein
VLASTLATRAGMPTWYTLGVLTGFDVEREPAPQRVTGTFVAANDVTLEPVRDERSRMTGVVIGAAACLLLLLVGALALGPRSMHGYKALAVTASDAVGQHASHLKQRVQEAAERLLRR